MSRAKPALRQAASLLLLALSACGARTLDPNLDASVAPVDAGPVDAAPCPPGLTLCDGGCTLTSVDPANCGACGQACGAGLACVGGSCGSACPPGQTICDQSCVATKVDPSHCGDCDTHCASGQACVNGACSWSCPPGQKLCGGDGGPIVCASLDTDTGNCGSCGNACPSNHAVSACQQGTCAFVACEKGFEDCDGDSTNGCETNVASDAQSCGRCGHGCCGGVCVNGACAAVTLHTSTDNSALLAVDATDFYWTEGGHVEKCATSVCTSPTILAASTVTAIAIDSGDVFWTGAINSAIVKCAKGGCGGTPTVLAQFQSVPWDLTVDGTTVYWGNLGNGGYTGSIMSCSVNGCQSPTVIASGLGGPRGLTYDAISVYWSDGNTLMRAFKGTPPNPQVIASGTSVLQMVSDGTSLFWADQKNGTVRSCLGGLACSLTIIDLVQGMGSVGGIAVDANNVYWTEGLPNAGVYACAKTGCGGLATKLRTLPAPFTPGAIAVQDSCVYWVNPGNPVSIRKIAAP